MELNKLVRPTIPVPNDKIMYPIGTLIARK